MVARPPMEVGRSGRSRFHSGTESAMSRNPAASPRSARRFHLGGDELEQRKLLVSSSVTWPAHESTPAEVVSLQVPSTYVSQSATTLDVTITRSSPTTHGPIDSAQTLDLSAYAITKARKRGGKPEESGEIVQQHARVTFLRGEMKKTVSLPISFTSISRNRSRSPVPRALARPGQDERTRNP
jgi:hypothetical protein